MTDARSGEEAVARDIFGWTPIHYSCVFNEGGRDLGSYLSSWSSILQNPQAVKLHKQLDRFGRSPVHIAASNGLARVLWDMFGRFITDKNEANSDILAAGADGMTPIHWAAKSGEAQTLMILLSKAPQVSSDTTDIWGREPLHIAARHGHEEVVDLILKEGRWSLSTDILGKNPVDYVLTSNHNDGSNSDGGTTDINATDKARRPVHDQRRLRILEKFAAERPDWKGQNGKGFLHYAVEATDVATVQKLVQNSKCNLAIEDLDDRTALHVALASNNIPTSLYLLGLAEENLREVAQAKSSLLKDACMGGCTDAIPRILELWPEAEAEAVNKGDARFDQPALSWAIERGKNDAVELVVNHHLTDLNRPAGRFFGFTPLHFAAETENVKAMTLLLSQPSGRIDTRKTDIGGKTPLDRAFLSEKPQTTRLLLLHPNTPATDRKRYLGEILKSSKTTFHDIVTDLFKHIVAHDALSAKELLDAIGDGTYLNDPEHLETFVMVVLQANALDLARGLYLPAVRANSARVIAELLRKGVDSTSIDEDGWSLGYCVKRFHRMELLEGLSDDLLRGEKETTYLAPEKLL